MKHEVFVAIASYADPELPRTLRDALATARVFLRLLDHAEQEGITDLDGLKSFLRRPRRRKPPRQGQQLELLDGQKTRECPMTKPSRIQTNTWPRR